MDLLMNEVQSLQIVLGGMSQKLDSLEKKINEITESQQTGGETVQKSTNSSNIIIKFLAGLRKLTPEELKNTLIEADAILNTVNPIPTDQNFEQTLEWNASKDKLKTILKEVFDLLNSLPHNTTVDANKPVASTSVVPPRRGITKEEEEKKIKFWRKYKNKYNYIEKLKVKLPPLNDTVKESKSVQNDVNNIVQNDANAIVQNDANAIVQNDANAIVQNDANAIVQNDANAILQNDANAIVQNLDDTPQNDLNDNPQNDVNDTAQNDVNENAQNDLNDKRYTLDDIVQNFEAYENLKSRLKNSPYDDPYFKNNVKNSNLCLTLPNGETIVKPVSHVAPLIFLKKCDALCPIPLQNNNPTDEQLPSTSTMDSDQINDSNSNDANMTRRETRSTKTRNLTNSVNTIDKAITKKRSLTIKNSKYKPSKKKRN